MSYIDADGKYHRGEDKNLSADVSSQYRSWSHDNQRKRMGADIAQPYNSDGTPNRDFIDIYKGEVADKYFSQKQQDDTMRKMS